VQIRQNGPFERWQIVSPVDRGFAVIECDYFSSFSLSFSPCAVSSYVSVLLVYVACCGVLWRVGVGVAAVCVCPAALGDASRAAFSVYIHFDPLDAPARRCCFFFGCSSRESRVRRAGENKIKKFPKTRQPNEAHESI
jgi:hypothetical protein